MRDIISKTDQKRILEFKSYLNSFVDNEKDKLYFVPCLTVFSSSIEVRWSIYYDGVNGEVLISTNCTKGEVLEYLENCNLY